MRESGLVSIGPNLAKSTFGQGSRLEPRLPPPERCGADVAAAGAFGESRRRLLAGCGP